MTPPDTSTSVDALLSLIRELQARNLLLEQQNALLTVRVADLERRLGLDSSNSSKPPSSDGPGQAPRRTKSLRERGSKRPGGQPGHTGKHLKRSEQVDHTIMHRPARCGRCQTALEGELADLVGSRQVFDLPAPAPLVVTEHQLYRCKCSGCGAVTTGSFPPEVRAPVQYGVRLAAVVTYLSAGQFLPEDRLGQTLTDLFGVTISAGTIGQMTAGHRSSIWMRPGFGWAPRRNGCMSRASPGSMDWCIIACHQSAARC